MESLFNSQAFVTGLDVAGYIFGHLGPPVVTVDEFKGLVSSHLSCHRYMMVSMFDALPITTCDYPLALMQWDGLIGGPGP